MVIAHHIVFLFETGSLVGLVCSKKTRLPIIMPRRSVSHHLTTEFTRMQHHRKSLLFTRVLKVKPRVYSSYDSSSKYEWII